MRYVSLLITAGLLIAELGFLFSCGTSDIIPEGITDSSIINEDNIWLVRKREDLYHLKNRQASSANHLVNDEPVPQIFFLNDKHGWLITKKGQIWSTENGGEDWNIGGSILERGPGLTRKIFFLDELVGWILELDAIWHTKDGGDTWERIDPEVDQSFEPLSFFANSDGICIVGATNGEILIGDHGKWQVNDLMINEDFVVVVATKEKIFAITHTGHMYESGRTKYEWKETPLPFGKKVISVKENQVWVGIQNKTGNAFEGQIIRSMDGGMNWYTMPGSLPQSSLKKLQFIDLNKAVAIGDEEVFVTRDGGATWMLVQRFP